MPRLSARERNVRAANVRLIEAEIRNYYQTVQDIREMEDAIVMPGPIGAPGVCVQTGTYGDPTPGRAERMGSSAILRETQRRVDAITHALSVVKTVEPARMEMIRLRYWDRGYTDEGICRHLHISRPTFYRWRRELLELVGERLGWPI